MVGEGVAPLTVTPQPCCRYLQVTIPDPTDRIITKARALVPAIEALATIEPSGPFERALAQPLQAPYNHELRNAVEFASSSPVWLPDVGTIDVN
jgi:hypothetical protein